MFGAISEKFRTFDMQINFAILPIFHFRRWLGEFFFPFSINLLRNYWAFHDTPCIMVKISPGSSVISSA